MPSLGVSQQWQTAAQLIQGTLPRELATKRQTQETEMTRSEDTRPLPSANRLLIVEDDDNFRNRLAIAMTRFGYVVETAAKVSIAKEMVRLSPPDFAVVDLRLEDGSGLEIVDELRDFHPEGRVIVLTGYGNIPVAVAAVRAGAIDVIAKPVTSDELHAALMTATIGDKVMPTEMMSPENAKFQHIDTVFERCERNVSETARQLNMHRRTLQRIMSRGKRWLGRRSEAPESEL